MGATIDRWPARFLAMAPPLVALAALTLTPPGFAGESVSSPLPAATPAPTPPVGPGSAIYDLGKVHRIDVAITPQEWAVLQQQSGFRLNNGVTGGSDYTDATGRPVHVGSGFQSHFPWVKADIAVDGKSFPSSGLRYRGNSSFNRSSAAAPLRANLKIKFDVFGGKGTWDGLKNFNFNAGTIDASLMREALAFALFRSAGVPAPRTAFAEIRFTVPGTYNATSGGLYVMIEDINKRFLEHVLPPGSGLLMKPEGLRGGVQGTSRVWSTYLPTYRPDRDATPDEQTRVMDFAGLVGQNDVTLFRQKIGGLLDVDQFLRFLAVNAFIENWDSYLGGNHNFYLYLDSRDQKFRFIPWDQDYSMGNGGNNTTFNFLQPFRGAAPLIYWLLDDPAVMARYQVILRELSATALSAASVDRLAATVEGVVGPRAASPVMRLRQRAATLAQLVASWETAK